MICAFRNDSKPAAHSPGFPARSFLNIFQSAATAVEPYGTMRLLATLAAHPDPPLGSVEIVYIQPTNSLIRSPHPIQQFKKDRGRVSG